MNMINRLLNGFKRYGLGDTTQVYTLPDGKQYTLTKAQIDAFNKVYDEAYGIAYSKLMSPPRVADVLKYGQVVADWYKQGRAFSEDAYIYQQSTSTGRSGSSTQSRQTAAEAAAAEKAAAEKAAAEKAAAERAAAERAAAEAAAAQRAAAEAAAAQAAAAQRAAAEAAAAQAAAAQRAAAEAAAAEAAAAEAAAAQRAAAERAAAQKAADQRAATEASIAEAAAEDDRIYYLNLNRALALGISSPSYDAFKRMSQDEKYIWFSQIQLAENERNAQTTPPKVVLPDNLPTVPPTEEEQGSGILVPAILFVVGTIAAIALAKSKPKKRR